MNHTDNPTPLSQHAGRALTMLTQGAASVAGSDSDRTRWMRSLERLSAGDTPVSAEEAKIARFLDLLEASSIAGPASAEPDDPPRVIGHAAPPTRPARSDGIWGEYRRFLRDDDGWPQQQVATLDANTRRVLEQLADPARTVAARTRGLVVGYVGSGKTAHLTGVIAKAIDAGYRLVIVVSGPLNLQRFQVQQRLERALLGEGTPDGVGTAVPHPHGQAAGRRPRLMRVTTLDHDYRSAGNARDPWDFAKLDPGQPLNAPNNLQHTPVRLLVVKKNAAVLAKLIHDLRASDGPLSELPALVIDDEPYDAVDSISGRKGLGNNASDARLAELLRLLPRSQYVNFSSTPFVRALLDPGRDEELFPRDFVAVLPRPVEHLEPHDASRPIPPWAAWTQLRTSGVKAALRTPVADTDDLGSPAETAVQDNEVMDLLRQAVDMFVLTGALKLYRQQAGQYVYRHHTMLVHGSERLVEQHQILGRLRRQWDPATFTDRDSRTRLEALFEQDILKHCAADEKGHHTPEEFDDLLPYIRAAAARMTRAPQLITGADESWRELQEAFTQHEVWGVLVGGPRIARELHPAGLTVSFMTPGGSSTASRLIASERLVNREGYRDLVRFYLGRSTSQAELAAEATRLQELTRAEERFYTQLQEISVDSAQSPLRPAQLPALAAHHAPWRTRARKNRIFNAKVVEIRSPGQWVEHLVRPARAADRAHNARVWLPLLQALSEKPALLNPPGQRTEQVASDVPAHAGVVAHEQLLDVFEHLRWQRPESFHPHLQYLQSLRGQLDDWVIVLPQQSEEGTTPTPAAEQSLWPASPRSSPRHAFPDPGNWRHRQLGEKIVEMGQQADPEIPAEGGTFMPRRGVLFLYPMTGRRRSSAPADGLLAGSPEELVMGIRYLVPPDGSSQTVRFTARSTSQGDAPILAFARPQEEPIALHPLSAAV
ncbi:Z1 domain-containing protein [Streptomyces niveus]|uniref:Z1 domain-containing protein n=1 Tax=Streptomyces niveus TaxID=193462 RepID=UPI0036A5A8D4